MAKNTQNFPEPNQVPTWFVAMLERLAAGYPVHSFREGAFDTYWKWLREFDDRVIAQGMKAAAQGSREYFPSAPAIEEECRAIKRRSASDENARKALPFADRHYGEGIEEIQKIVSDLEKRFKAP